MRCPHCPAPTAEHCRGEEVHRFCQLVDPNHPDYQPAYIRILVRDDVIVDQSRPPDLTPMPGKKCCGGSDDIMAMEPE